MVAAIAQHFWWYSRGQGSWARPRSTSGAAGCTKLSSGGPPASAKVRRNDGHSATRDPPGGRIARHIVFRDMHRTRPLRGSKPFGSLAVFFATVSFVQTFFRVTARRRRSSPNKFVSFKKLCTQTGRARGQKGGEKRKRAGQEEAGGGREAKTAKGHGKGTGRGRKERKGYGRGREEELANGY